MSSYAILAKAQGEIESINLSFNFKEFHHGFVGCSHYASIVKSNGELKALLTIYDPDWSEIEVKVEIKVDARNYRVSTESIKDFFFVIAVITFCESGK